jgi:uncharacterized protein YjhX (UPF0386 family)
VPRILAAAAFVVFPGILRWTFRATNSASYLLAQGGRIEIEKNESKKIASVQCLTRDGWRYPGFDLEMFRKLRRKKAVSSMGGGPYRITRRGLELVRAELDNR